MSDGLKKIIGSVVVPVLSSIVTVLLIIPGEQGESILGVVIEMLKKLVA